MDLFALQDLESEKGILSCIVQNPSLLLEIYESINLLDFTNSNYRDTFRIFQILQKETATDKVILDLTSVKSASKRNELNEDFFFSSNGETLIQSILSDDTIDIRAFKTYCQNLKNMSARRSLYKEGKRMQTIAETGGNKEPVHEMIEGVHQKLSQITTESIGQSQEPQPILEDALDILRQNIENPKEELGFYTGFPKLDKTIEGLQPGRVYIVGARYKVGKTTFLLNCALNIANRYKIPVLFISTEMTDSEMMYRTLAKVAKVEEVKLKKGILSQQEKDTVFNLGDAIKAPLYHIRVSGYSVETITSIIRKFIFNRVGTQESGKANPCLIVFDYMKMPEKVQAAISFEKETQVLGMVATKLKDLANEFNFPLLTAGQENRDGELAATDRLGWFFDCEMELKNKSEFELNEQGGSAKNLGNQVLTVKASRNSTANARIDIYYDAPILTMTQAKMQRDQAEAIGNEDPTGLVAQGVDKPIDF